jgi:NADPH-dependent curcumin reductase CurA
MKTGERLVTERNRRLLLLRRPVGLPVPEDFELVEEAIPKAPDGAILVRNHLCSLDPAIRGWLEDAPSYIPPIALNDAVRAITAGRIVTSRHPDFQTGDWVVGMNAIEDYSIATPDGFLRTIDPDSVSSITLYLSALGALGVTAYFGVMDVCRPRPGETMLINGAAGAVGSLVGQIARIKGCRTIGIAGGPTKCKRLIDRYGFDAAIDYRGKSSSEPSAALAAAAPDGVDMVFENVGGMLLDTALMHVKSACARRSMRSHLGVQLDDRADWGTQSLATHRQARHNARSFCRRLLPSFCRSAGRSRGLDRRGSVSYR